MKNELEKRIMVSKGMHPHANPRGTWAVDFDKDVFSVLAGKGS